MGEKRSVAIVGPSLSGKTTLLESLLFVTGAISRKGSVKEANTVGDASPEARARQTSVEISAASTDVDGVTFTFLDCPGSVEFWGETRQALVGVDATLVVFEPVAERALTLAPIFRVLDGLEIPHLLFVNKMDRTSEPLDNLVEAVRAVAGHPLVLQQFPIIEGESLTGYVDLFTGKAYAYKAGAGAQEIAVPEAVKDGADAARTDSLEKLADFDDALLEKLLEDQTPTEEEATATLRQAFAGNKVVPVFFGATEQEHGVRRLIAWLAELVPSPAATAGRRGVDSAGDDLLAQVLKNYMTAHGGKLSLARIWRGTVAEGEVVNGFRVGGVYRMLGQHQTKLERAEAGDIVALGRLDDVASGETLAKGHHKPAQELERPEPPNPVYARAITAEKRQDEVKLSGAVAKVLDEDPSLSLEPSGETNQLLLWGQGELHLQVALDRLKNRYNLPVKTERPKVPYKEAIRKGIKQHGRFKRQTGGHGMYGDVHLEIKPLPRGSGFQFHQTIAGGAVPKQYIPAVESGVIGYLKKGPLGFPVVDISVTLFDGGYHEVDSSEQSFKLAARVAMSEGMPRCDPILLEPIYHVEISVPSEFTSRVQRLISGRRGHILGFEARSDWEQWDMVTAHMPQAELHDLINELRSLTLGVGGVSWRYDHLTELTGRLADQIVAAAAEEREEQRG
ncbi:MAG: elongation factor G [Alphaproteobacteria bacterium]